ncbi:undecaprenyl-phosphate glucose phosphotransferase [Lysobacter enzymogenes]|uniref:undecaprenyl-phosphate glucose phosphotransferase n=1 Tax=Lysobacter enzymogenes TaxID=69 RepID=UPI003CCDA5D3
MEFSSALFASVRPSAVRNVVAIARLTHFLIVVCSGALALYALESTSLFSSTRVLLATLSGPYYIALALWAGLLCVLVFNSFGLYGHEMFGGRLLIRRTLLAWMATFGLVMVMHLLFRFLRPLPDGALMLWFGLSFVLFVGGRLLLLWEFRRRIRLGHFIQRSVILGMTENALRLAEQISHRADVISGLVGYIDDRRRHRLDESPPSSLRRLGDIEELERLIREGGIDQVLLALPAQARGRNEGLAQRLRRLPVQVLLVPDMSSFHFAHRKLVPVAGVPMFVVAEPPLQGWAPVFKRGEDIVLSAVALLCLSPLMALLALAVKLDSPGPVLFRQKRYGYNHRLIEVFKFRSMHHDLRDENAAKQTLRDDPRVTRVGRFIRKTSLDELPQLFNVLAGSMSLVGPRPHATATKAGNVLFEDAVLEYVSRHRVKPGITGLAQVNGYRGETDTIEKIQRRVEYDLEYIENWSLWLDLSILLRTLPAVLSAKSAY